MSSAVCSIRRLIGIMHNTVNAKDDLSWRPLHGIDMHCVTNRWDKSTSFIGCVSKTEWIVDGTLHVVLIATPMLHNVYFTTCRPSSASIALQIPIRSNFVDVLSQHPYGRPRSNTARHLCPYLNPSVGEGKF